MPVMSGRRAFLELLKQEGVEVMFGNPGTTELSLMDALASESGLRYVLGLQEAAVMGMADGYAQASGKLAAVNLHVAPGLGNAMGMLYDALKAGSPLIVTAGQHDQGFNLSEPILWEDLPAMAKPLVKWAYEVRSVSELPRAVHRAATVALAPPTGPVFLSLPADVLKDEADIELGTPTRVRGGIRGERAALEAAAELLARAERPVLIAGDAVTQSRAHREMVALAELLGAPVWAEGIASTASFPASHPLFAGAMVRSQKIIRDTLAAHDVLFSAGGDLFTLSLPADIEPVPDGLAIVHLDTDPWELGKNHATRVAILGDPKASLPELTQLVAERLTASGRDRARTRLDGAKATIAKRRQALAAKARGEAEARPARPLAVLHAIAEALPANAVVIDETLSSGGGLRDLLKSDDEQSFYGLRGGGIGWGVPAAIGVKVALPDRPVVALVGDGSSLYTIQALWSAAHDKVPVVVVILNNSSYRILKQRTDALRGISEQTGRYVGMDLVDPAVDFQALARGFGVESERVETASAAASAVKRAIAAGGPRLVEVVLDRSWKSV
jgi:benzoylformate decarboxylase